MQTSKINAERALAEISALLEQQRLTKKEHEYLDECVKTLSDIVKVWREATKNLDVSKVEKMTLEVLEKEGKRHDA